MLCCDLLVFILSCFIGRQPGTWWVSRLPFPSFQKGLLLHSDPLLQDRGKERSSIPCLCVTWSLLPRQMFNGAVKAPAMWHSFPRLQDQEQLCQSHLYWGSSMEPPTRFPGCAFSLHQALQWPVEASWLAWNWLANPITYWWASWEKQSFHLFLSWLVHND